MSAYYHYPAHAPSAANVHPIATAAHHSGRGKRAPRYAQNHGHRPLRAARREEEAAAVTSFRHRFELQRSFDLDDDLEFCPALLTEGDMVSVHSASSDRSSLSSGSPQASPQSHSVAPESSFSLNSNSTPFVPAAVSTPLKLHQPAATRTRSAIPIVNPMTGLSMSSPPQSVSPSRMQPATQRW